MHDESALIPEDLDDAPPSAGTTRFKVDNRFAGERLDKALAQMMPHVSRSRMQQWIGAGAVRVNGAAIKARHALAHGDVIDVEPQPAADAAAYEAEAMPLDVVFEDDAIIVLDKPPGLVVHPATGNWSGTLLNGLLAHAPALSGVPRAGIVHRLDADTSGLMVVAKTLEAQTDLVRQLQLRSVEREYWAIVLGVPPARAVIDVPIGRDPRNPLRFKVSRTASAKPARTHVARIATARVEGIDVSWIACRLETGRTHQIRVHLEHLRHPLIGDPVYRRGLPAHTNDDDWKSFGRQALHACRLGFEHPVTRQALTWFRAPAPDMARLMRELGFNARRRRSPFDD